MTSGEPPRQDVENAWPLPTPPRALDAPGEDLRAHPFYWSTLARARTTPVLLGLFSLITVLALQLSGDGQIPGPVTAWYHKDEPTFSNCLALVHQHLWRARYSVNSTLQVECRQFPHAALDLLIDGVPVAA